MEDVERREKEEDYLTEKMSENLLVVASERPGEEEGFIKGGADIEEEEETPRFTRTVARSPNQQRSYETVRESRSNISFSEIPEQRRDGGEAGEDVKTEVANLFQMRRHPIRPHDDPEEDQKQENSLQSLCASAEKSETEFETANFDEHAETEEYRELTEAHMRLEQEILQMHRGISLKDRLGPGPLRERPGYRKAVKSSDRRRRRKELPGADKENVNSLNLGSARDLEVRCYRRKRAGATSCKGCAVPPRDRAAERSSRKQQGREQLADRAQPAAAPRDERAAQPRAAGAVAVPF